MSYYIHFDDGEGLPLATTSGWGDFRRWAETLPPTDYGDVELLCRNGESDTLNVLRNELEAALRNSPPNADDVQSTAKNLLSMLKDNSSAEHAHVSNGMEDDE